MGGQIPGNVLFVSWKVVNLTQLFQILSQTHSFIHFVYKETTEAKHR